jgi:hypothetical protein
VLKTYHLGVRSRVYYKSDDIQHSKTVKVENPLPIVIHGIQKNFVKSVQSLGIPCTVSNMGTPELVPIVDVGLAEIFGIPVGTPIVRRGRLQGVQGTPYRLVTNWYPTQLADNELVEEMRRNDDADMPALIKQKYGVIIEHITEMIVTRTSTPEERKLLKMRALGPVFEIRRTNYATDGSTVVMVSDLILVARYFRLKYTYDTAHWQ